MKIGYPCINYSLSTKSNSTFRLKSFSAERFLTCVNQNLDGLEDILHFNAQHGLDFFRISSDLIPFASHPICQINWHKEFKARLKNIGKYIIQQKFRISMHPSQFVLINALNPTIIENSIRELQWHCELLDLMELPNTAKVQIHVGGIYGNKAEAVQRFITNYKKLPQSIRNRLVIENDDRLFSVKDVLSISAETDVPIIFDNLHHECLHNGESLRESMQLAAKTWKKKDGIMMVDYSSQASDERLGKHAESIDLEHFKKFIQDITELDFDIMLEIKDKERSALLAKEVIKSQR